MKFVFVFQTLKQVVTAEDVTVAPLAMMMIVAAATLAATVITAMNPRIVIVDVTTATVRTRMEATAANARHLRSVAL